jgi:mannosyltransferase
MESTGGFGGRAFSPSVLTRQRRGTAWVPWALAGLIVLAAAIRFATLGLQSYHHDEAWTAGVVLHSSLFKTLDQVGATESTPPLYYVLAWVWSKLFGNGEWGLRSLSALFGVATIPVIFAIGRRLAGDFAGLAAAALAAVNPALIWYSQEARAYSLLILLSALGFLFFLRARDGFGSRDLALWGVFSALAIAAHYFGVLPAAIEGMLLLAASGRHRRGALIACGCVAAAGLALAPLALHQSDAGHAKWIGHLAMTTRLKETAVTAASGETGRFIDQPPNYRYAYLPLLLLAAALALLFWRGREAERRAGGLALAVAAATLAAALVAALLGTDYVLARNLLPALPLLLVAAAIGLTCRGAGRLGLWLGTGLVAYWLAFGLYVDARPKLQRPDWRDVAADIGSGHGAHEIVTSGQATVPLRYYLPGRTVELHSPQPPFAAREIDVVSIGKPPPRSDTGLPAPFRAAGQQSEDTVTLTRYVAPRPLPVPWSMLLDHYTGFQSRDVLAAGPGAAQLR